jgi:hypothetical protein
VCFFLQTGEPEKPKKAGEGHTVFDIKAVEISKTKT